MNLNESDVDKLGTPLADVSPVEASSQKPAVASQSDRELDVVYIDLDCLLDTRMGILAQHHPELAKEVLADGRYGRRLIDQFGSLTSRQFEELYEKRDMETLRYSVVTNVPLFLQRIIKDAIVHASMAKVDQELKYVINVWPYAFEDQELLEVLAACIRYHTLDTVEIEVVRIPPSKLTPTLIKKEYDIILMYSYQKWLYSHREEFDRVRCPSVTLVVPQLFYLDMPDQEALAECRRQNKDPMSMAEEQLGGHIRLKTVSASLFCMSEAITQENAADISLELRVQPEDIEEAAKKIGATVIDEPLKKPSMTGVDEDVML